MIVIGIGSNLGDRRARLRDAIRLLHAAPAIHVKRVSPVYESDAMLLPGSAIEWGKPFLNAAVEIESSLEPNALLPVLKAIEARMGRRRSERWAPREIDLDLLCWDALVLDSAHLKIPHPGLPDRPFALLPLDDLLSEHAWKDIARKWRALMPLHRPFRTTSRGLLYPELVAILNLTPDSFSGDGVCRPEEALASALLAAEHGAAVLDVGAESTRPGAEPISAAEEWNRLRVVLPDLVQALHRRPQPIAVSLDTRHVCNAEKALSLGVDWINDVSGFQNPEMRRAAATSGAAVVAMHSLSVPADRSRILPSGSPLEELLRWAEERIGILEADGIDKERIIFDPGIGFGKNPQQTLRLLEQAHRFHALGTRVLIGHSRKSYLESVTNPPEERDLETAVISVHLARQGIDYLRVHNVDLNRRALQAAGQVDGIVTW